MSDITLIDKAYNMAKEVRDGDETWFRRHQFELQELLYQLGIRIAELRPLETPNILTKEAFLKIKETLHRR
mgnify:CR=1 FL=1